MLLRICLYSVLLFLPANYTATRSSSPLLPAEPVAAMPSLCRQLYTDMQLDNVVNYTAFEQAITGAQAVERRNKDIITLIDFTKPSTEERLYVLDIRHKKLLFSSLVSHGKNSGGNYATSFSNKVNSYKSSLGFFVTENTYQGKNGYSLILNGLEKGINDRAKERAIV
ncbi:murein L,D-transpeptidase catalytic domain family protein, partial [uncultured Parabacteroides sp.]